MEKSSFETEESKSSETAVQARASLMSSYAQASFGAGYNSDSSEAKKAKEMKEKVTNGLKMPVKLDNILSKK